MLTYGIFQKLTVFHQEITSDWVLVGVWASRLIKIMPPCVAADVFCTVSVYVRDRVKKERGSGINRGPRQVKTVTI